ncbi:putative structural/gag protein [Fusarium virguliforme dsRNA mycovirus 1]|uniref:Putative structural/gag protein n=1 Tax=Fusarium virguliforme dsRNA mycovirus 1 TaxID=1141583 RepID=H6UNN1_9VIRU|nr:putative structural/gag protein [Fusarium virguliforme dsRNA mycovirus 1]
MSSSLSNLVSNFLFEASSITTGLTAPSSFQELGVSRAEGARLKNKPLVFSASPGVYPPTCGCNIDNQGHLVVTFCKVEHPVGPLPPLPCHASSLVKYVDGGCYAIGWKATAHAAVFKLLSGLPTAAQIMRLWIATDPQQRCNPRVKLSRSNADPSVHHLELLHLGASLEGSVLFSEAVASVSMTDRIGSSSDSDGGVKAREVYSPQSVAALGGVRLVPTSLPVPQLAPGFNQPWAPTTWPTQATDDLTQWRRVDAQGRVSHLRTSNYVRHYPAELNNPRLPQAFSDTLESHWFRELPDDAFARLPATYSRSFSPDVVTRSVLDEFTAIGQVMTNNNSLEVLKEADAVGGFSRALGSRGQRLVPGWEANIINRWQRFRELATRSNNLRSYKEFSYRIASRYVLSQATADLLAHIPDYMPVVEDTSTDITIIHINADSIVPPPPPGGGPPPLPIWGEQAFWDPNMQQAMIDGRAQFVDGEGFSPEEIAAIIGCLAPSAAANVPYIVAPHPDSTHPLVSRTRDLLPNVTRHYFPNGTTHIIVHHGNSPIPPLAVQAQIAATAFSYPSSAVLGSIMRAYCARHALEESLIDAFDNALYRCTGFSFAEARGSDPNSATREIVDSSGSSALFLPRNNTARAYFDVFFSPLATTSAIENLLSSTAKQYVHYGSLLGHVRATSLAWAGKSASLVDSVFSAPAAGGNQFIRNHRDKWLRQYYSELNVWSALHANAQAHQFGFSPTRLTRRTESGFVPGWWRPYVPPVLTNHYLELWSMHLMPTYQVLPYWDPDQSSSHVQWAKGTPDQTASLQSFSADKKIRLARETEAFPGHAWLGDGGADYNAQFYVAQGNDGQFAFEGGRHKARLFFWDGIYARSFPNAPVQGNLLTMTNGALNQPFSDFLLPGSLLSYRHQIDRILSWGVSDGSNNQLTPLEIQRWWLASKGRAHTSLMVNYVSPFAQHYERDVLADYTVTIWEKDSKFAGLTFSDITKDLQDSTFNPVDYISQQGPLTLNFDSAPRPYMQNQPTRVAARQTNRPPVDVTNINRRIAETGKITYKSKYPHFDDELPPMESTPVEVTEEGIVVDPRQRPMEGDTPSSRLAEINAAQQMINRMYEQYMSEERTKAAVRRAAARQPRTQSPPLWLPSPKKPRVAPKPRPTSMPIIATKRLAPSEEPIIPNDAAAVEAQQRAMQLRDAVLSQKARPATPTVRGRTPSPKRSRSRENANAVDPSPHHGDSPDPEEEWDVYPETTPHAPPTQLTPDQEFFAEKRVASKLPAGAIDFSTLGDASTPMSSSAGAAAAFMQQVQLVDPEVTQPKN